MNTFHDMGDEQKLCVAHKHLKGKVKCSACDRRYVDISHREGSLNTKDTAIELLVVTRWIGFDEPESITMDLKCRCGHGGFYTITPNPFIG